MSREAHTQLAEFDQYSLPQESCLGRARAFFKANGRRLLFGVIALALILAVLYLSNSSRGSNAAESSPTPSAPDAPSTSPPPPSPSFSIVTFFMQGPLIFTALLTSVAAIFYKIAGYVFTYHIARHLNLKPSVTVTNLDPNFNVVMEYLATVCIPRSNQRALEAETCKEKQTDVRKAQRRRWYGVEDEKTVPQRYTFVPASDKYSNLGPSAQSFTYRPYVCSSVDPKSGQTWDQLLLAEQQSDEPSDEEAQVAQPWWAGLIMRCWLRRTGAHAPIDLLITERDAVSQGSGSDGPRTPTKWLNLSQWGSDAKILKQVVNDALLWSFDQEKKNSDLKIFVLSERSWVEDWSFAVSRKRRVEDSVVFDDDENGKNILRDLIDDAQNFFSDHTAKTYAVKGMPHRRGYLLYGPPGCGKTSFITVLAGVLNKDVCILNLNDALSDNGLASALRSAPLSSIIALEDVDAIFMSVDKDGKNVKDKRQMKSGKLTFSGLLNALDGVASQEGRILIMTTNHREKLDPALIRPGRVDVEKEIRNASRKQIEGMFLRFYGSQPYPQQLVDLAKTFAAKLPEYEISMAKLQGFFQAAAKQVTGGNGQLSFCVMPDRCIDKASELMKHGDQDSSMSVFEHFWRIGVERYAAHFERQRISNISQFRSCDIDSVAASCVELELDPVALSTLKKLQKEEEEVMTSSYAEADVSTIRDLFFAAFPSTDSHGNMTVYSRFNSIARTRSSHNRCQRSLDAHADSPRSGGDDTPSAGGAFVDTRSLLELGTSVQSIIKSSDSQKKTPLLFHTSVFRIKQLFEWYSNRPYPCEAMLKKFIADHEQFLCEFSSRQSSEHLAQQLDLASFLKRLVLPSSMTSDLADSLIFEVKAFMEFCSNSSVHVLCSRFSLQVAQAKRLVDFCCKDENKNSPSRRMFVLPTKQEVRSFFIAHYASCSSHHFDESSANSRLELYAIEFAEKLCDSVRKCTSVVSYFEIEEHLVDKTPALACADEVIKALKTLPPSSNRGDNSSSAVFEHLFRIGLQQYAPAFVKCGATSVVRFRSINMESVCDCCPLLALDSESQSHLKLLQKEDEKYILENYASASRLQINQVLQAVAAPANVASSLLRCNVSLYLLRNITAALPELLLKPDAEFFECSITALFQPFSIQERKAEELSFMCFVRRLAFPPATLHAFTEECGSVSKFVKDVQNGDIKGLSQRFIQYLPEQHQRLQLDAFCSSSSSSNAVSRLKFLYPSTRAVAEAFLLFFSECGSSLSSQELRRHAFYFSRVLCGCGSDGAAFPFRGHAYVSLNEVEALLQDKFLTFAENKEDLTIETTVSICKTHFEYRKSDEYLREPDAPEEPPPPAKTDVRLWLEGVFPGDGRAAEEVCKKLKDVAIRKMVDLECMRELSPDVLQTAAKLRLGEAWKVHAAFQALKAVQKQ